MVITFLGILGGGLLYYAVDRAGGFGPQYPGEDIWK